MTFSDAYGALAIIVVIIFSSLLSEFVSYLMVYRREDYKHLCDRIIRLNASLRKEDEKVVSIDKRKTHEKGIERIEDDLKDTSQKIDAMKLKASIVTGISFVVLYRMVAAAWTGQAVARLPFLPVSIVQSIALRGLDPADQYQCSFNLIYTLCTIGIKGNIPKLLGFTSPKSAYDHRRMAARQERKKEL